MSVANVYSHFKVYNVNSVDILYGIILIKGKLFLLYILNGPGREDVIGQVGCSRPVVKKKFYDKLCVEKSCYDKNVLNEASI